MKKLPIFVFLGAMTLLGADFSLGINIGPPPAPRVVHAQPPRPGPDFTWVDGYWYPINGRYSWHDGYWTRAPYANARWIGPRYEGGRFFEGYWDTDHGRIAHDHRWDRDRDRDWHHDDHRDEHH